jgi:hypothetical protein
MPQPVLPPSSQTTEHVVLDVYSNLILRYTSFMILTLVDPQTGVREHRSGAQIQTVDGHLWHPGMANIRPLAVCEICRRPSFHLLRRERPSHGLCLNAVRCAWCGIVLCPRHRSASDGHWFCPPCARSNTLYKWLIWPFCVGEEE